MCLLKIVNYNVALIFGSHCFIVQHSLRNWEIQRSRDLSKVVDKSIMWSASGLRPLLFPHLSWVISSCLMTLVLFMCWLTPNFYLQPRPHPWCLIGISMSLSQTDPLLFPSSTPSLFPTHCSYSIPPLSKAQTSKIDKLDYSSSFRTHTQYISKFCQFYLENTCSI